MNLLKGSYVIGGVYDILLGIGIIFLRSILSSLLHQMSPNIPILADSLGLFLIAFGLLLVNESKSPNPNISIGLTSALVRICYFIFVIYYVITSSIETFYVLLAFTDLSTGLFIGWGILEYKKGT